MRVNTDRILLPKGPKCPVSPQTVHLGISTDLGGKPVNQDLTRRGWHTLSLRHSSIVWLSKCHQFPSSLLRNALGGRPWVLQSPHRSQLVSLYHLPRCEHPPRDYRTPKKMPGPPES